MKKIVPLIFLLLFTPALAISEEDARPVSKERRYTMMDVNKVTNPDDRVFNNWMIGLSKWLASISTFGLWKGHSMGGVQYKGEDAEKGTKVEATYNPGATTNTTK